MFAPGRVEPTVEDVLREELAQGDAVIGSIGPILQHFLANDDHSLFNDEIVARVRGMIDHLVRQMLDAIEDAQGTPRREYTQETIEHVVSALVVNRRCWRTFMLRRWNSNWLNGCRRGLRLIRCYRPCCRP